MTQHRSPRLPSVPEPHRRGDRVQKGSTLSVAEMKARQTSKLRQLADALIAAGFVTLGEQDALAEGGYVVLPGLPDPLRARLQRRSH